MSQYVEQNAGNMKLEGEMNKLKAGRKKELRLNTIGQNV